MASSQSTRQTRAAVLTAAAFAALAAGPGAAAVEAATLRTDFPCYFEDRTINWSAEALRPGTRFRLTLDGTEIDSGNVAADGTATGSLTSADLGRGVGEQRFVLAITDGTDSASTPFRVSEFNADFAPAAGNPRTLLVRFSVFGFGMGKTIFLHYIRPGAPRRPTSRHVARTVRLGRVLGVCGKIRRTRERHLFPFEARAGEWRLQFDTRSRYRAGAQPAVVRRVRVAAR
jgi:hypothetical protein